MATNNLDPSIDNSPITRVTTVDFSGTYVSPGGGGSGSTTADAASSPNASIMTGGEYNSTPPSLTNGTVNTLQLDSSARLLTNNAPLTGTADSIAINDGTNTASVVAGDPGFNGVAIAGATKTYTFTTSASGAQTILANTPTEGYSWIEVVYTSVGSGLALTGQWSTASGGTYVAISSWSSGATAVPTQALGVAVNTYYGSAVRGNYFQLAVSALTSGTFSGTVTLRSIPPPVNTVSVGAAQSGTWGVGLAAQATGGYSFSNITTATTTTVKSGAGTLHAINFNTLVASATVTVYDNTTATGTKIGTFTIPSTVTGADLFSINFDAAFATGLTIVTSGATDLTVLYK